MTIARTSTLLVAISALLCVSGCRANADPIAWLALPLGLVAVVSTVAFAHLHGRGRAVIALGAALVAGAICLAFSPLHAHLVEALLVVLPLSQLALSLRKPVTVVVAAALVVAVAGAGLVSATGCPVGESGILALAATFTAAFALLARARTRGQATPDTTILTSGSPTYGQRFMPWLVVAVGLLAFSSAGTCHLQLPELNLWLVPIAVLILSFAAYVRVGIAALAAVLAGSAGLTAAAATAWLGGSLCEARSALVFAASMTAALVVAAVDAAPYPDESTGRSSKAAGTVVAGGLSAALGFAALSASGAGFLRRLGLGTAAGLVVSSVVAAIVLPPLVGWLRRPPQRDTTPPVPGSREHHQRVARRFARFNPWMRFSALGKLKLDPMFGQLGSVVPRRGKLLDVGCGAGIVASWLDEAFPELELAGFDELWERVRIARLVAGPRAQIAWARLDCLGRSARPDWARGPFDAVLCADVIHHLDDDSVVALFRAAGEVLSAEGILIVRTATLADQGTESWPLWLERLVVGLRGQRVVRYRTREQVEALLLMAGLRLTHCHLHPSGGPEVMFVAVRDRLQW